VQTGSLVRNCSAPLHKMYQLKTEMLTFLATNQSRD